MEEYKIVPIEKPEEAAWGIIGKGVHVYNIEKAGEQNFKRICFAIQDADDQIAGGVLGEVYWDWLYIDLIWVTEDLRGEGYGQRLMVKVEEEARKFGAKQAYLDTFSFQAPAFYEKLGYRVYGELQDFPPGHQRFFYSKHL